MTDDKKAWEELVRWSEQFANVALTHKMQVAILAKDAECKGLAKQYVDMKSFADFTEKENKRLREVVEWACSTEAYHYFGDGIRHVDFKRELRRKAKEDR